MMEASLLPLLCVLVIAWTAGLVANRLGLPSILGELGAGIIFGPAVLGSMGLGFTGPIVGLDILAEVGIFALMLFIGMEVNYRDLIRNGMAGGLAAVGGFAIPFVAGWALAVAYGYSNEAAAFLGMAMGVTSLATKSRILVDLKLFGTRIANVLLSGALLADVGALLVFAIILGMTDFGSTKGGGGMLQVAVFALAYFIIAAVAGLKVLPWLGSLLQRIGVKERTVAFTFVLLVGLAYAEGAHLMGLHPIIGAFLAGAFLRQGVLKQRLSHEIAHGVRDMAVGFLAPIFFFTAGFHVTLNVVVDQPLLVILVVSIATFSKIIGTAMFYTFSGNGWREGLVIGAGMNGRGAVEIIIAEIALGLGLIDGPLFSVLVLMAFFTTLTVPVGLKYGAQWLERRDELVRTDDERRGLIIVGATSIGRLMARHAMEHSDEPVCLVDSNPARCLLARKAGLPVIRGNALREDVMILAGARDAASIAALTPNTSINQLACRFAQENFGVPMVAQAWPEHGGEDEEPGVGVPVLWPIPNADMERKLWEHRAERHPDEIEAVPMEKHLTAGHLSSEFLGDRSRLPVLVFRKGRSLLVTASKLKPADMILFLKRPAGRTELTQRFREAIDAAPVLDIARHFSFREFLQQAAEAVAPLVSESPETIRELFLNREREFSSVLVPGLAIPHAFLAGEKPFVIVLARAKEGVVFPGQAEAVRMIFLMLGSEKDKDLHLHALASIARVVSSPGFEIAWLGAPEKESLPKLVLLGDRSDEFEAELQH